MGVFAKQGSWWIDYYVEGRRKRERIGGPLTGAMKKVAQAALAKRRVELAEGRYLDKRTVPRCTFAELADLYLSWAKVHHRSYSSTKSRTERLVAAFGHQRLSTITPLMIERYLADLTATQQPATVNHHLQLVRHMFQKAQEWGKALTNPTQGVRPLRVQNRRLRYLSHEEIARLLDAADATLRPLVILALQTGLRRGELFALTWDDLDFQAGVIRVVHTKNGERRELPMTPTVRETLRTLPRRLNSDLLFPGKTGEALVDIRKRFATALRQAGITGCVFHDLRHTFASHLVMAGVDLMTVKEFLGHKSMQMTLRYAHLAPDHKQAAMRQLDTYMDTRQKERGSSIAGAP